MEKKNQHVDDGKFERHDERQWPKDKQMNQMGKQAESELDDTKHRRQEQQNDLRLDPHTEQQGGADDSSSTARKGNRQQQSTERPDDFIEPAENEPTKM